MDDSSQMYFACPIDRKSLRNVVNPEGSDIGQRIKDLILDKSYQTDFGKEMIGYSRSELPP